MPQRSRNRSTTYRPRDLVQRRGGWLEELCRWCRDVQNDGDDLKTAELARKIIRSSQVRPKMINSLIGREITMAKRPRQWRHVSNGRSNVYAPRNTPIKALAT